MPTYILGSKYDCICPFSLFEDDKRFDRNNIKKIFVEDAGHLIWLENPMVMKNIFSEFISELNAKQQYLGDSMKERIIQDWVIGYNNRDFEAIESVYSKDAVIHSKKGDRTGGAAVVEIFKKWIVAVPDGKITPLHVSEEKDNVVVLHWRCSGTFKEQILDIPATGEEVAIHGATFFRHENGKVIEHWATVDYRPFTNLAAK